MVTFDVGAVNPDCVLTDDQAKEVIRSLSDEKLKSLKFGHRYLLQLPNFTLEFYRYDEAYAPHLLGGFIVTNVFSNADILTLD